MSELVPTARDPRMPVPRGMIFEPTEQLAMRIVGTEEQNKQLRRKLTGRTVWMLMFGAMLLTAAAALVFVWLTSETRVAAAEAEAAETIDTMQTQLADTTAENTRLREVAQTLETYRGAAKLQFDISQDKAEIEEYQTFYESQSGIDIPEGLFDYELDSTNWLGNSVSTLTGDKSKLETALSRIDDWLVLNGQRGSAPRRVRKDNPF